MAETKQEKIRRLARERKLKERESNSNNATSSARLIASNRRNNGVQERLEARRTMERNRIADRRTNATREEVDRRRNIESNRIATARANLSQEEIEERRYVIFDG